MADIEANLKILLDNPVIMGLVAISLTMYGPRLSPKLPDSVRKLFDQGFFRFMVIVLIIWVGSHDIRLSLTIAILFMVMMSLVNNQNIKEDFDNQLMQYYHDHNLYDGINNENFADNNDQDVFFLNESFVGHAEAPTNFEESEEHFAVRFNSKSQRRGGASAGEDAVGTADDDRNDQTKFLVRCKKGTKNKTYCKQQIEACVGKKWNGMKCEDKLPSGVKKLIVKNNSDKMYENDCDPAWGCTDDSSDDSSDGSSASSDGSVLDKVNAKANVKTNIDKAIKSIGKASELNLPEEPTSKQLSIAAKQNAADIGNIKAALAQAIGAA
jgi:hypothetical protein